MNGKLRIVTLSALVAALQAVPATAFEIVIESPDFVVGSTLCTDDGNLEVVLIDPPADCRRARLELRNSSGMSFGGSQYVYRSDGFRTTYSLGSRGGALQLAASCRGETAVLEFRADRRPPRFSAIELISGHSPNWTHSPAQVNLTGVTDDGRWLPNRLTTTYQVDGGALLRDSGTGRLLEGLSEGEHELKAWLEDGCGRTTTEWKRDFHVDNDPPTLSLEVEGLGWGATARRGSGLSVEIVTGDPGVSPGLGSDRVSGVSTVNLYLDGIPREFEPGRYLCAFRGPWRPGFANRSDCCETEPGPPFQVCASDTVQVGFDWSLGEHRLVAIAWDHAGNQSEPQERYIFVLN